VSAGYGTVYIMREESVTDVNQEWKAYNVGGVG
jgi:hypothetical protein